MSEEKFYNSRKNVLDRDYMKKVLQLLQNFFTRGLLFTLVTCEIKKT